MSTFARTLVMAIPDDVLTSPALVFGLAGELDALAVGRHDDAAVFLASLAAVLADYADHVAQGHARAVPKIMEAWSGVLDDPELRDRELES